MDAVGQAELIVAQAIVNIKFQAVMIRGLTLAELGALADLADEVAQTEA